MGYTEARGGSFKVQLRYSDTDQMGLIYFSRHLVYADEAVTQYIKERGIDINSMERKGVFLAIAAAHCEYEYPLRYGDDCVVNVRLRRIGNTSITFDFEIYANDKLSSRGYLVYVVVDSEGRKITVPSDIRGKLTPQD